MNPLASKSAIPGASASTWARRRRPRLCGYAAFVLELAKFDPADLAGQCLRQIVDELDLARIRIRRKPLSDEAFDFLGEFVGGVLLLCEDDERLDDVPA